MHPTPQTTETRADYVIYGALGTIEIQDFFFKKVVKTFLVCVFDILCVFLRKKIMLGIEPRSLPIQSE